jgi:hypothetical protein
MTGAESPGLDEEVKVFGVLILCILELEVSTPKNGTQSKTLQHELPQNEEVKNLEVLFSLS